MAATKPMQIRISTELLERVDAAAAGEGMTRTQWIVNALEGRLDGTTKPKRSLGTERCRHPIGRRIGGMCALCGERP
jgi:hypothetical protein